MNIKKFLAEQVSKAMVMAGIDEDCKPLITRSTRPEFGHYQANGALPAAKKMKVKPRELAAQIIDQLALENITEKIAIAGPGFINIHLSPDWLAARCGKALAHDKLGVQCSAEAQTVVVDYSAPNLAKEMHVGHLRSTIIGDAVARVLEFMGEQVIRQNHMGDWGTQFGMLIAELEEQGQKSEKSQWALSDLEGFYQRAKVHFDSDSKFADKSREYVVKLQAGDSHCLQLWQRFICISKQHSAEIYSALGVTLQDEDIRPESAYNDDLPRVIELLQQKGLAVTDQGAEVVFLNELADKEGNPSPVIVRKSDGGYLYATTDLAALRYRVDQFDADRILYFVDARQSLHLQQVFNVARKAGFVDEKVLLEHLAFGTMMGRDGKPFKTRTGGTVKLRELLNEAVLRAKDLVRTKNPDLPADDIAAIAESVGIGAIKYADLSKNRTSDYVFNWDTMLNFEGDTAPYLQYAYTRIQSIFSKGGIEKKQLQGDVVLQETPELTLAVKLLQFPETVEQVAKSCEPHQLCSYLYGLASEFMSFYEACPILKEGVPKEVRESRLQLCRLTASTLSIGLDLLGIRVMDKM